MKFSFAIATMLLAVLQRSTRAWTTSTTLHQRSSTIRSITALNIVLNDKESVMDKIRRIIDEESAPTVNAEFDQLVKDTFPGAMDNNSLEANVVEMLATKYGYTGENTLLATSLCCDELARRLEDDFNRVYGHNFNLGGLAGFPFAGNTGFGAMSAHIPDNGFCLVVYGPHVGITKDGQVGKVERAGIKLVDTCCGSAVAANAYLQGITDGGAQITADIQSFSDFQQGAVQQLILPFGKRLTDADNRMVALPYALYESQDLLMRTIVQKGSKGIKKGLALLGGIQINTAPDELDYFHPLRFDYMNNKGEVVANLLPALQKAVETNPPPTKSEAKDE